MTELVQFNGTWYVLVRQFSVDFIGGNLEGLKDLRDYYLCDRVLRHRDFYLLVRDVDDVEITN